jgi:hypothetical protein
MSKKEKSPPQKGTEEQRRKRKRKCGGGGAGAGAGWWEKTGEKRKKVGYVRVDQEGSAAAVQASFRVEHV